MRKQREIWPGIAGYGRLAHGVTSLLTGLGGVFDTCPLHWVGVVFDTNSLAGVKTGVNQQAKVGEASQD
jgi:hypothetical protein